MSPFSICVKTPGACRLRLVQEGAASWRTRCAVALALAVGAAISGGCAKRAEEIAPSHQGAIVAAEGNCMVLDRARAGAAERLIFASIAQNQVAREDREHLFGIAPSGFGVMFRGDRSEEVAALKARLAAIDVERTVSGCSPAW
jgi:hypothetical protein